METTQIIYPIITIALSLLTAVFCINFFSIKRKYYELLDDFDELAIENEKGEMCIQKNISKIQELYEDNNSLKENYKKVDKGLDALKDISKQKDELISGILFINKNLTKLIFNIISSLVPNLKLKELQVSIDNDNEEKEVIFQFFNESNEIVSYEDIMNELNNKLFVEEDNKSTKKKIVKTSKTEKNAKTTKKEKK